MARYWVLIGLFWCGGHRDGGGDAGGLSTLTTHIVGWESGYDTRYTVSYTGHGEFFYIFSPLIIL